MIREQLSYTYYYTEYREEVSAIGHYRFLLQSLSTASQLQFTVSKICVAILVASMHMHQIQVAIIL